MNKQMFGMASNIFHSKKARVSMFVTVHLYVLAMFAACDTTEPGSSDPLESQFVTLELGVNVTMVVLRGGVPADTLEEVSVSSSIEAHVRNISYRRNSSTVFSAEYIGITSITGVLDAMRATLDSVQGMRLNIPPNPRTMWQVEAVNIPAVMRDNNVTPNGDERWRYEVTGSDVARHVTLLQRDSAGPGCPSWTYDHRSIRFTCDSNSYIRVYFHAERQ